MVIIMTLWMGNGAVLKKVPVIGNLPFPKQALVLTCLKYKSFENTLGKGVIARNGQFLLFT